MLISTTEQFHCYKLRKLLQGAVVGERINTTTHIAPRIGFNYDLNGKS
jgi:hypothetical protein